MTARPAFHPTRRLPWLLLLIVLAVVYYASYVKYGINFRDEGGTVALLSKRLLAGERPFLDVILGYNVLWFYPVVGLFKLFGVNFVLLRGYCFFLSTITAVLAFLTVERASRRPWLAFLVALLTVVVPGMTFKNYMPLLAVSNIYCLLNFALGPRRREDARLETHPVEAVAPSETEVPVITPTPMHAPGGASWPWLLIGAVVLGLTFLIRIDVGTFFLLLWIGGEWLLALRPRATALARFALVIGGPVVTIGIATAVHLPVYLDATNRGFAKPFLAQYTGWPDTLIGSLHERLDRHKTPGENPRPTRDLGQPVPRATPAIIDPAPDLPLVKPVTPATPALDVPAAAATPTAPVPTDAGAVPNATPSAPSVSVPPLTNTAPPAPTPVPPEAAPPPPCATPAAEATAAAVPNAPAAPPSPARDQTTPPQIPPSADPATPPIAATPVPDFPAVPAGAPSPAAPSTPTPPAPEAPAAPLPPPVPAPVATAPIPPAPVDQPASPLQPPTPSAALPPTLPAPVAGPLAIVHQDKETSWNTHGLRPKTLADLGAAKNDDERALIILRYAPLFTLVPLALWALIAALRARQSLEPGAFERPVAALLVLGGALTIFPQYFFFRSDAPHISEFSPGFWTGAFTAVLLLGWGAPRRFSSLPRLGGSLLLLVLILHAGLYLWCMIPNRWTGTIAARATLTRDDRGSWHLNGNRNTLFHGENGVDVYVSKKESTALESLKALVKDHSGSSNDYLVAYPYHPSINLICDRRTYEKNVYIDNATREPGWNEAAIRRIEKYRPNVIVLSDWDINGTEDSRFSVWAGPTKTWIQTNYLYQTTLLEFEIYTRPEKEE